MVKKFIRNIAFKLVGKKTPEQKKLERLGFIRELLAIQKLLKNASKPEDLLGNIAKNFLVEKVMVSKKDGTVLMASGEDSFERAVKTSSLIELINNEFPDTRFFMVKDAKGYKIFYLEGDFLYSISSAGEVSILETKRIAEELRKGVVQFSLESKPLAKAVQRVGQRTSTAR